MVAIELMLPTVKKKKNLYSRHEASAHNLSSLILKFRLYSQYFDFNLEIKILKKKKILSLCDPNLSSLKVFRILPFFIFIYFLFFAYSGTLRLCTKFSVTQGEVV